MYIILLKIEDYDKYLKPPKTTNTRNRLVKYIVGSDYIKIDRLIGIITVLLQNEKVTAPYLAEKFEVSRRTICRDIEDICKDGIPVVTTQGTGGGIYIAEGYKIDKTLFTTQELRSILTGLKSLDSISDTSHTKKSYKQAVAKKRHSIFKYRAYFN